MSNEAMRDTPNIAVFCDYENVALGAQDAKLSRFDLQLALARVLDKGKVIVKKAYSDWDRFKAAKRSLHEAGFELIEVPHASYSGKNSADIRLVVDALDLCYTKQHLDTFVIMSGDSDFSPLVAKLRENDKVVIGLGVRNSSSGLLIGSCDEFIYYDDLVTESSKSSKPIAAGDPAPKGEKGDRSEAVELVLDTIAALDRDHDTIWSSMVKQTLKRKHPNFSEGHYGFRNFSQLMEAVRDTGDVVLERDARSGGYVVKPA